MSYYRFDLFQFDDEKMVLRKNGRRVALAPKTADLLLVFLKEPEKDFSKDELIDAVWGDKAVEQGNLPGQVLKLRIVLEKRSDGRDYIDTVYGKGYRFMAKVQVHDPSLVEAPATEEFTKQAEVLAENPTDEGNTPDEIEETSISFISRWKRNSIVYLRRSLPYSPAPAPISIFVIAIAIVAIALWWRLAGPTHIAVDSYTRLSYDLKDKVDESILTDGVRVFFTVREQASNTFEAIALAGAAQGRVPLPDSFVDFYDLYPGSSELLASRQAADAGGPELWVVPLLGPPPRRIDNLRANSASWSPDGQQIAYGLEGQLSVANADGSESRSLAQLPGHIYLPRWSPDGKVLRFSQSWQQKNVVSSTIWEVGVDGSNLHRLLPDWREPAHDCCGVWTPDGRFFIFQSEQDGRPDLWAMAERRSLFGASGASPVKLTRDSKDFSSPVMEAKGKQLFAFAKEQVGELVRFNMNHKKFEPYLESISASWVSFSRSGRFVAYVDYRSHTLWRAKADGSQPQQLTFPPFEVDDVDWSPDEKSLVLRGRDHGKPWKIYRMLSNGGDRTALVRSEGEQGIPTWSADGKRIAFGDVPQVFGKPAGSETIHILDLNTHTQTGLPGSRGLWSARWAPDGRSLCALTIKEQRVMLYDFITKRWTSTEAAAVNNATWSNDGRYIYYDTNINDGPALRRLRVTDLKVELLTNLRGYPNLAWWWSGVTPDNSPLLFKAKESAEVYSLTLDYR